MNIFVLSDNTFICARYHCDKHVIKMILESAQMLSTAVRISGIDAGYKSTHINHPCNKWVRKSLSNWYWLKELSTYLNEEYIHRFHKHDKKNHKSYDVISKLPKPNIKDKGLTPFAQAMPERYKNETNAIKAYRNYYVGDKWHLLRYTKRNIPYWIKHK